MKCNLVFYYSFYDGRVEKTKFDNCDTDLLKELWKLGVIEGLNQTAKELNLPICKNILVLLEPIQK